MKIRTCSTLNNRLGIYKGRRTEGYDKSKTDQARTRSACQGSERSVNIKSMVSEERKEIEPVLCNQSWKVFDRPICDGT